MIKYTTNIGKARSRKIKSDFLELAIDLCAGGRGEFAVKKLTRKNFKRLEQRGGFVYDK